MKIKLLDTKQTSQEASHTVDTVSDDVDRNSTNTPVDDIATNSSDTQVDEVTDNTGDTTEVKDIDAMLDDVADEKCRRQRCNGGYYWFF